MNRTLKKYVTLILITSMFVYLMLSAPALAQENNNSKVVPRIISPYVPQEVVDLLTFELDGILAGISSDLSIYGLSASQMSDAYVGSPFATFDDQGNPITEIYYFPLWANGKILGIFTVSKAADEKWAIAYGKDFSESLNSFHSVVGMNYVVLADENGLEAFDATGRVYALARLSESNLSSSVSNMTNFSKKYSEESLEVDIAQPIKSISLPAQTRNSYQYRVIEGVQVVPQSNQGHCWASTMASIINFLTPMSLSRDTVDVYGFGHSAYTDGMALIGQYWLSDYGYDASAFFQAFSIDYMKYYIDRGIPQALTCFKSVGNLGHAVTLIGYDYDSLIILDHAYQSVKFAYKGMSPNYSDYYAFPFGDAQYCWNQTVIIS